MANETKVVCVNVFQHTDTTGLQTAFTEKWIALINQYEKNKGYWVAH